MASPPKKEGGKKKSKNAESSKSIILPKINPRYLQKVFQQDLSTAFEKKDEFEKDGEHFLLNKPFMLSCLPNFVESEKFLQLFQEEIADHIFYEKNNDLYKFQQTDDFKKISTPYSKAMRRFLSNEVRKWLSEITGLHLEEKVDVTCSRYDYTDVLLCHDDHLDTRRIAYVLYLVPTWNDTDGGSLDLFNMDNNLQPDKIVKSIFPRFNQLVWFEVTEASYHQVAEVLSESKSRLSVNGWFHTEAVPRSPPYVQPKSAHSSWNEFDEDLFFEWINPIYLDPDVQSQIREKFEKDSEIELKGFLDDIKYQILSQSLKTENIQWSDIGPPNKRKYKRMKLNDGASTSQTDTAVNESDNHVPAIVTECLNFLMSETMFLMLSNLTGLSLHHLACVSSEDDESSDDTIISDAKSVESNLNQIQDSVAESSQASMEPEVSEVIDKESKDLPQTAINEVNISENKYSNKRRKLEDGSSITDNKDKKSQPKCSGELRKWQHSDYTLCNDTDAQNTEYALDAMFYCCCKGWKESFGGQTTYITKNEDEQLLSVLPSENSLALVYRDKDTLKFNKYINDTVRQPTQLDAPKFYEFSMVYYE